MDWSPKRMFAVLFTLIDIFQFFNHVVAKSKINASNSLLMVFSRVIGRIFIVLP